MVRLKWKCNRTRPAPSHSLVTSHVDVSLRVTSCRVSASPAPQQPQQPQQHRAENYL